MYKPVSSRSSVRSLRQLVPRDYKKMSKTGFGAVSDAEREDASVAVSPEGKLTVAEQLAKTSPGFRAASSYDLADSAIDEEMKQIQEELDCLNAEETRLKKSKQLEAMRQQLRSKRSQVKSLRGISFADNGARPKNLSDKSIEPEPNTNFLPKADDNIDLDFLRQNEQLKSKAKKELKKLGLSLDDSETSDNSSTSYFESEESDSGKKKKKDNKKKLKSGINAKASDRVKFPQRWPQAYLQFEFVNKQLKFDDLDFKQFVAGELEIIGEEDLSQTEKAGRLNLLKKIVYYSSTYEFKGLKAFYAAWVRDIERGRKQWSDDPSQIEGAMLSKFLLKNSKGYQFSRKESTTHKAEDKEERVWFCSAYQRNKCNHKSNHMQVVKGKMRLASHICASCWIKDKKKLDHPECSTACPHLSG